MTYQDPQTGEIIKTFRPRCAKCKFWEKTSTKYGICTKSKPSGFRSAYESNESIPNIKTPKSALCDNFETFSSHY